MHSTTIKLKTMGEVTISHNSDWSGEAIVTWFDPPLAPNEYLAQSGMPSPRDRLREVRLPGKLLLAVSAAAAQKRLRDDVIGFLENWSLDWSLGR
jgi:hypothetical protein